MYLPTGHLVSEKIIYLLKFQVNKNTEVKFFKPIHKKTPQFYMDNFNLENLSINKIKFENIKKRKLRYRNNKIPNKKNSICSQNSLDISQDSIDVTEFKKNRTINKNLS